MYYSKRWNCKKRLKNCGQVFPVILNFVLISVIDNFAKFAEDVWKLEYEEKPDYDKLSSYLSDQILGMGDTVNFIYDWNMPELVLRDRTTSCDVI